MNHGRLLAKRCITEVRLFIPPYTSVTKRITIIDLSPKKDMFIFIFIWRERERERQRPLEAYTSGPPVCFFFATETTGGSCQKCEVSRSISCAICAPTARPKETISLDSFELGPVETDWRPAAQVK